MGLLAALGKWLLGSLVIPVLDAINAALRDKRAHDDAVQLGQAVQKDRDQQEAADASKRMQAAQAAPATRGDVQKTLSDGTF